MLRTILLVVGCLLAMGAATLGYLAYHERPHLLLVDAEVHNCGTVGQGETRAHTFVLTNNTGKTVRIVDIVKTCGCAETECQQDTLAPGEKTTLLATWRVGSSRGSSGIKVVVRYEVDNPNGEDFQEQLLVLDLLADVAPDIAYAPQRLEFTKQSPRYVVEFAPGRMQDFVLKNAKCMHPAFQAKLLPGGRQVEVTYDANWGFNNLAPSNLVVETDSLHEPACMIPLEVLFDDAEKR